MPEISGMIQQFLEGNIKTLSGSEPVIESKTITENGSYTAPEGVDGYSPVVVNVPSDEPVIESKTITENGTYTPEIGVDGFAPVVVNVQSSAPVIESKNITENGTYTVPEGVDGYSPVTVNVPQLTTRTLQLELTNNVSHQMYYPESGEAFNVVDVSVDVAPLQGVRIAGTNYNRITLPQTDSNNYEYVLKFYNSGYQHNTSIIGNSSGGYNIQLTEYGNAWYCDGGSNNQLSYTPASTDDFIGHFTFVSNAIAGTMDLSDRDIALFNGSGTLLHKFGTKGTATTTAPEIWLLSRSGTGVASNGIIERLTIKDKSDNNSIVCDYVPAMVAVNGVKYSGLYDSINQNFIYNAYAGIISGVAF